MLLRTRQSIPVSQSLIDPLGIAGVYSATRIGCDRLGIYVAVFACTLDSTALPTRGVDRLHEFMPRMELRSFRNMQQINLQLLVFTKIARPQKSDANQYQSTLLIITIIGHHYVWFEALRLENGSGIQI